MNGHDFSPCRWIAGLALGLLVSAPVAAATYNISLFEPPAGTGSGSFDFANAGSSGVSTVSLSTNASSKAGARAFQPASLAIEVAAVNFSDNKTPANRIVGNFVEGLTGSLITDPPLAGVTLGAVPCPVSSACFYRITFAFASNPDPNLAVKSYTLELVDSADQTVIGSVSGTYGVANTATIPEPGSLALLGLSLAGLAWFRHRSGRACKPH